MSMLATLYRLDQATLDGIVADPGHIHDWLDENSDDEDSLELEKAWHGLHFLLTGAAWAPAPPLDFLAVGGRAVGDEDVGYGPARSFTREDVRAIAAALEKVTVDALRANFRPKEMQDVYPSGWTRDAQALGWLLGMWPDLRAFVSTAASRGQAMLVTIQ